MPQPLKISEQSFEDILFEHLQTKDGIHNLARRGLSFGYYQFSRVFRQFCLNEYGRPDLIRFSFDSGLIKADVIELKIVPFEISHLLQLGRYIAGIRHAFSKYNIEHYRLNISGKLIVCGFNDNAEYTWLDDLLNHNIEVYHASFDITGIDFERVLPGARWYAGFNHKVLTQQTERELLNLYRESYWDYITNPQDLPF